MNFQGYEYEFKMTVHHLTLSLRNFLFPQTNPMTADHKSHSDNIRTVWCWISRLKYSEMSYMNCVSSEFRLELNILTFSVGAEPPKSQILDLHPLPTCCNLIQQYWRQTWKDVEERERVSTVLTIYKVLDLRHLWNFLLTLQMQAMTLCLLVMSLSGDPA